ncbi:cobyrinate a,c-diamide synthase [Tibeticola sp.]|jgi:cobyrinic acid a,c-diamide synthase|uniref:cobyrinate a,c-diamide synthase n=1 Tax=Tibeticola sp. TaxID=2005368 RepID=UPI00258B8040|nr:cobyrinate a,c-diamide synthase [Tibeticola sp.]MCI4441226.1 cobyrinate a,c-diamide synthase [Tibeticola sp.]
MPSATCPALLISAPASGQGKTTVTAALARLWTRRGARVRVFKCGPDFLDPHWHALASGQPVDNLDLWINGETDIRARLHEAAAHSDLILIEGVMGLFDGEPSAADLAVKLGLPVLAVIDAGAMAGTFGALVHGLRHYRPGLPWAGVLANRVASEGHEQMLRASVRADDLGVQPGGIDAGWLGGLRRDTGFALPERHLGLTSAAELPDAQQRLDALADALEYTPLGRLDAAGWQRWAVAFEAPPEQPVAPLLRGRTVAVARDAAFCFIYPANLDTLRALGAELVFFSPLADEPVPDCDALWLPGGYPELHADALQQGMRCRTSLAAHIAAGKPVWAECGGMMPLFDAITLADGARVPMWGLLPGEVAMQPRLAALGAQRWRTSRGELRGHSFHYSTLTTPLLPVAHTEPATGRGQPEAVYGLGALRASYFHAWFASNLEATEDLFTLG